MIANLTQKLYNQSVNKLEREVQYGTRKEFFRKTRKGLWRKK